jgi:hypothetical protein
MLMLGFVFEREKISHGIEAKSPYYREYIGGNAHI